MKRLLSLSLLALVACSSSKPDTPTDSTFAAMQNRGQMAMGVDQYQSKHRFTPTPDGGTIELQSDTGDSLDVAQIRAHLKLIQHAFKAGDFSTPTFVHAHAMPGSSAMSANSKLIEYSYKDLPRGGEVRITSSDKIAVKAIHDFLDAQSSEHHVMQ